MNSLTRDGEEYLLKSALLGANESGIAHAATALRLYTNASTPAKTGVGFVEVATGTYVPKVISNLNWTYSAADGKITLADQTWTAAGTPMENIAGAYITDVGGSVLAWWERSPTVTLAVAESITADDLAIALA